MKWGEELKSYSSADKLTQNAQKKDLGTIEEEMGEDDYKKIIQCLREDGNLGDLTQEQREMIKKISAKMS